MEKSVGDREVLEKGVEKGVGEECPQGRWFAELTLRWKRCWMRYYALGFTSSGVKKMQRTLHG